MSDVVDKIIGISGGVSAVLAFVFYKCYRGRSEFARHVKDVPIFHPDDSLYDTLKELDNGLLEYAAVEGVVKDLGRTISSHHVPVEGVVKRTQLTEHKSKRVNGFWSESKKDLRDKLQTVPFALLKSENSDSNCRVEVVDPQIASHLQEELDLTYDKFEPHKSSIVEVGLDRLFGEVTKGVQETETMLINGTSVLALGRICMDRGKAKLAAPSDDKLFYIITKMSLGELVRSYESQSKTFKVLSIISGLVGSGLLLWLIWRNLKKWLKKREERMQFDNIRRALRSQGDSGNTVSRDAKRGDGGGRDQSEDDACVICLTNPRQVIALTCGHISTCLSCAEALPTPKKCPICRADVERFMQAFYS